VIVEKLLEKIIASVTARILGSILLFVVALLLFPFKGCLLELQTQVADNETALGLLLFFTIPVCFLVCLRLPSLGAFVRQNPSLRWDTYVFVYIALFLVTFFGWYKMKPTFEPAIEIYGVHLDSSAQVSIARVEQMLEFDREAVDTGRVIETVDGYRKRSPRLELSVNYDRIWLARVLQDVVGIDVQKKPEFLLLKIQFWTAEDQVERVRDELMLLPDPAGTSTYTLKFRLPFRFLYTLQRQRIISPSVKCELIYGYSGSGLTRHSAAVPFDFSSWN
jgi:hypothetical protein